MWLILLHNRDETNQVGCLLLCSAEDMTSSNAQDGMRVAGMNSILPKEHGSKFYTLAVVKNSDKDVWTTLLHVPHKLMCHHQCSLEILIFIMGLEKSVWILISDILVLVLVFAAELIDWLGILVSFINVCAVFGR